MLIVLQHLLPRNQMHFSWPIVRQYFRDRIYIASKDLNLSFPSPIFSISNQVPTILSLMPPLIDYNLNTLLRVVASDIFSLSIHHRESVLIMVVNLGGKTAPSLPRKWQGGGNENADPERRKTNTETSEQKVPVIYYLSRNGQVEHPHLMEVPMSSPQGLYLKGK